MNYAATAKTHEELKARDKKVAGLRPIQNKRKKALQKAQEAFAASLVHLAEAETLALELHNSAGGIGLMGPHNYLGPVQHQDSPLFRQ